MVDLILNTLREFIEPLPTYVVWRSCHYKNGEVIHAANANVAKRMFRRNHGLKSNTPLNVNRVVEQ